MAKYPKYKVAAVQAAPVYLDLDATVKKSVKIIEEAAANGAKLIGFPEGFLPGYPWFAFLGRALDYVPKFYHKLYLNAVEVPSDALAKISQAARDNDIYVCISGSEKDGGSLYLTQFWFNNKGDFIIHKESDFYNNKEVMLKNVAIEPLIVENENFVIRQILLNLCCRERIQPNIYFNTSGFSLCYKLCRERKGNTISMGFIFEDMKDKSLRKIPFREHLMWNVAIVYRKDCFLSDNMKKLIQFACDWCRKFK